MEDAPAVDMYQRPRHPYTQVLLGRANPLPEDAAERSDVASANGSIDARCPFSDRCPMRQDRCFRERPALLELSPVTKPRATSPDV